jgi:DNA-binding HxlR family transcriptional regulator
MIFESIFSILLIVKTSLRSRIEVRPVEPPLPDPDSSAPSHALLELVKLRWSIPILALLMEGTTGVPGVRGGGAKFITLVNQSGIPPASLRRTLTALIEQGWIMRNPGHGHPLRPEYVLDRGGLALARTCQRLMQEIGSQEVADAALRKWSLPIALVLTPASRHFQEIRRVLRGITPRALAQNLKIMEAANLIDRSVAADYPPRPVYSLSAQGLALGSRVRDLEEVLAA